MCEGAGTSAGAKFLPPVLPGGRESWSERSAVRHATLSRRELMFLSLLGGNGGTSRGTHEKNEHLGLYPEEAQTKEGGTFQPTGEEAQT